jgi:hypothetical protein
MALDDEDFPSPPPLTRMVVFPTATQGVGQTFAYPPNFGSNNWWRGTPRNNYPWPNQWQSTHMIFTHCHNPLFRLKLGNHPTHCYYMAPRYPCSYSHFAK